MKRVLAGVILTLACGVLFAAIDSRDKRTSAATSGDAWVDTYPNPDGTLDAANRAHIAGEYGGLVDAEPPEPGGGFDSGFDLGIGPRIDTD